MLDMVFKIRTLARNVDNLKQLDYLARLHNGISVFEQPQNASIVVNRFWRFGLIDDSCAVFLLNIAQMLETSNKLVCFIAEILAKKKIEFF